MNQMQRTIMLPIILFILFILALVGDITFSTVTDSITDFTATYSDPYVYVDTADNQVTALFDTLFTLMWVVFLFAFVGSLVWLFWGSHEKEHETYYRESYNPYNRR